MLVEFSISPSLLLEIRTSSLLSFNIGAKKGDTFATDICSSLVYDLFILDFSMI